MRHLLSTRTVRRESVHTETPAVSGITRGDIELLLAQPRQVVLLLTDGELVFCTVIERGRIRRWGRREVEDVDLSTLRNVCVAIVRAWESLRQITRAQRYGRRITRAGSMTAVIESPSEAR